MAFDRSRRILVQTLGIWFFLALLPISTHAAEDPPQLAGTWTWKWKDGRGETHKHTLEIEGEGAKMVARERYDDQAAIKVEKIKLDGNKLTIAVDRKERRSVYVGTIASADTINGVVTVSVEGSPDSEFGWTATREAGSKKP